MAVCTTILLYQYFTAADVLVTSFVPSSTLTDVRLPTPRFSTGAGNVVGSVVASSIPVTNGGFSTCSKQLETTWSFDAYLVDHLSGNAASSSLPAPPSSSNADVLCPRQLARFPFDTVSLPSGPLYVVQLLPQAYT